jgi:hypothetical protein
MPPEESLDDGYGIDTKPAMSANFGQRAYKNLERRYSIR